jgi:ribosomal silencing factor RsfS
MAMEEMRRQYAVALTDRKATQALRVSVRNVVNLADYRAVIKAMADIQTLVNVRAVAVAGDVLTLELAGIGDVETLIRLMASRSDLVWIHTDPNATEGMVLAWQAP